MKNGCALYRGKVAGIGCLLGYELEPLPRVPDDEHRKYDFDDSQDNVEHPLAWQRDQNDQRVDRAKDDVQPPIQSWPQDQRWEHHGARYCHRGGSQ
jgi:hypothetical protein